MPTPPDLTQYARDIAAREAKVTRRETLATALEAQIQRQAEQGLKDAAASITPQQDALDAREAALTPREAAIGDRESAVTKREADVASRERTLSVDQAVLRQGLQDYGPREQTLRQRELDQKAANVAQQQRHQAEAGVFAETQRAWQADVTLREQRLQETATRQRTTQSALDALAATVDAQQTEATRRLEQATVAEQALHVRTEAQQQSHDDRMRALDERQAMLDTRSTALDQAVAIGIEKANATEADRARLDQLAKGLQKAKLDHDTREAKLERRERLVNALIENKGLHAELAALE